MWSGPPLPLSPSWWALWQPQPWHRISSPWGRKGSALFPRVSSLPEAEAEGWPWLSPSLLRGKGPTFVSRAGLGTGRGPERPTLLPTYVPHVGAQADKLQNSLELRKTGPAVGCAPSLSAAPGPWLGAPGKGEEAAAAHGPGAGRCCLGEGASLTSSRAAISHAVRTLNLKGPCVPASERAFVSNAYCERKRNHSYPPAQGCGH